MFSLFQLILHKTQFVPWDLIEKDIDYIHFQYKGYLLEVRLRLFLRLLLLYLYLYSYHHNNLGISPNVQSIKEVFAKQKFG